MAAFINIALRLFAGYSIFKIVSLLAKFGLFFASFKFVQSIVDQYIAKIMTALSSYDSDAVQLLGLLKADQCLSIIFSAIICGVALKLGGKLFKGSEATS